MLLRTASGRLTPRRRSRPRVVSPSPKIWKLCDRAAISTASLRFTPASMRIAISFKRRIWSSRFARLFRIARRRLASAAMANDKGIKPRRFSSRSAARSCSATSSPLTLFPTLVSALYIKVGIADRRLQPRGAASHSEHLIEAGFRAPSLDQAIVAKRPDALSMSHLAHLLCRSMTQDGVVNIRGDADHLVEPEPASEPRAETFAAADRAPPPRQALEELGCALSQHFDLTFHFAGDLFRCGAMAAQSTRQPLCHDKPHSGCYEKRLDAHINKPSESAQRVVGVQSREYHVPGQCRLHCDLSRL